MKSRFDLEQEINQLYNFADQIDLVCEGILEHNLTNDEITNALYGIKTLLNLQTNKLHDTMCQCFNLDNHKEGSSCLL